MSDIQIFAFVILPLSIAVFCSVVAWLYGRDGSDQEHGHEPGE